MTVTRPLAGWEHCSHILSICCGGKADLLNVRRFLKFARELFCKWSGCYTYDASSCEVCGVLKRSGSHPLSLADCHDTSPRMSASSCCRCAKSGVGRWLLESTALQFRLQQARECDVGARGSLHLI